MIPPPEKSSGTTSGQSTQSEDGSTMSLEGLLRGNLNGKGKETVDGPDEDGAEVREGDDHGDLSGVQRAHRDAKTDPLDGLDLATKAALAEILGTDKDAADDEAGAEGGEAGDRRDKKPALGVKEGQKTLAAFAEELDLDGAKLYKNLMIPLNDGTGRHVSLEKLRAGYMGTDADTVSKDRAEHEQRLAAFEVDKSEHETRTVRERHELSQMFKVLAKDLPPEAVRKAQAVAQRQLADAAAAMLERFPEWRDPKVAMGWQARAYECLKPFGFSKAEAAALTDVRLCSFLDKHIKLVDWAEKVRNPKPVSKRPRKASRDTSRASPGPRDAKAEVIAKAKAAGATPEDKLAGVMAVLAGNSAK